MVLLRIPTSQGPSSLTFRELPASCGKLKSYLRRTFRESEVFRESCQVTFGEAGQDVRKLACKLERFYYKLARKLKRSWRSNFLQIGSGYTELSASYLRKVVPLQGPTSVGLKINLQKIGCSGRHKSCKLVCKLGVFMCKLI